MTTQSSKSHRSKRWISPRFLLSPTDHIGWLCMQVPSRIQIHCTSVPIVWYYCNYLLFKQTPKGPSWEVRLCHSSSHNPSIVHPFTKGEAQHLDPVSLFPYPLLPSPSFTTLWSYGLHADVTLVQWAPEGCLHLMSHLPGCLSARHT